MATCLLRKLSASPRVLYVLNHVHLVNLTNDLRSVVNHVQLNSQLDVIPLHKTYSWL